MKKLFTAALLLMFSNIIFAQLVKNPVQWTASSKKISDKTYEVRLSATIPDGWHIYSQNTPDGGPVPTEITFTKNPLVTTQGKAKEVGKMEKHFEPLFNVDVLQYSEKVDFVQIVKLKANVKTKVDVAVEFMVCDDKQCLPPSTKKFTLSL
ncbi:MAG: protein-disulfide reductase DsbD domain-containing protein [Ginsengibacter sp.]